MIADLMATAARCRRQAIASQRADGRPEGRKAVANMLTSLSGIYLHTYTGPTPPHMGAEQRAALCQVEVQPEAAEEAALARERHARLRRRAVHHHRRERDDARLHRVEDAEVALLGDAEVVGDDD